jgi:hypothetical protein
MKAIPTTTRATTFLFLDKNFRIYFLTTLSLSAYVQIAAHSIVILAQETIIIINFILLLVLFKKYGLIIRLKAPRIGDNKRFTHAELY